MIDNRRRRCVEFTRWRLTSDAYWSDGVLVESEALLQRMSSHVLVEDIAPGEIENATVVLVFGDEPTGKYNKGTTVMYEKHPIMGFL